MKKIVIFLFLIVFLCIKNVRPFNYMSNDSYNLHTLIFENLSTNNFLNYFSNIDVIKVYPYINPIYGDRIGDLSYDIRGHNLSDEINNFKEKYLNTIKKNSYLDYNYLYTNGINISKMDVYITDKDLYDIINSGLLVYIVK